MPVFVDQPFTEDRPLGITHLLDGGHLEQCGVAVCGDPDTAGVFTGLEHIHDSLYRVAGKQHTALPASSPHSESGLLPVLA
ncbi:hypothetical protein HGA13_21505 [Nocardia speluncae]|uniref:Uncharacterized protein n=1 Tax=Nocardia speluncae TaxID=419477 RepID=A0A846XHJ8_9NOCA|nr:hypothetical protein [Nocardia speluncae]NKY35628.1 hypothetical protein [Nocardia speluncae]